MHHVAEALDLHEPRYPNRPGLGHPAYVVPPQVHEHQMLGPLLLVLQQLGGETLVLSGIEPPPPRARDGAGRDRSILHSDQRLWR